MLRILEVTLFGCISCKWLIDNEVYIAVCYPSKPFFIPCCGNRTRCCTRYSFVLERFDVANFRP